MSFLSLRYWAFSSESLSKQKKNLYWDQSDRQTAFQPRSMTSQICRTTLISAQHFQSGTSPFHLVFFLNIFFTILTTTYHPCTWAFRSSPSSQSATFGWGSIGCSEGSETTMLWGGRGYGEVKASEGKAWDWHNGEREIGASFLDPD